MRLFVRTVGFDSRGQILDILDAKPLAWILRRLEAIHESDAPCRKVRALVFSYVGSDGWEHDRFICGDAWLSPTKIMKRGKDVLA